MSNERALYQKVILDHNKSPRNFGVMEDPDFEAEGYNALCGDQFRVYLRIKDGIIEEVQFEGSGCAISKSSASIMTTLLKGKTREEAKLLFDNFKGMITSNPGASFDAKELGKLIVFSGVREFPIRVKCATLAWHTLLAALKGEADTVSTE